MSNKDEIHFGSIKTSVLFNFNVNFKEFIRKIALKSIKQSQLSATDF